MAEQKKTRRFKLFDFNKDGKGISKKQAETGTGLKRFFISYRNNFGKIIYVNIFMVLGNFPLIFLIAALSGYTKIATLTPMQDIYQNLGGFFAQEASPLSMTLFALEGVQNQALVNTPWTYVFYGLSALTIFTFGIVNAGTAYILRNIAKGEPVFVWSDFWYAVKRNWKQALPFGVVDVIINGVLLFNIYSLFQNAFASGEFFAHLLFWANIVIFVLYFVMRFYIYVQMVTFKLRIFKIIKNSLIFTLAGFKRNIVAFCGIAIIIGIEVLLVVLFNGVFISFAVAAPLALLFSTMAYMKVYASYYKIKEVMIDPYVKDEPEIEFSEDDIIMHDDVTEKERLAEIKRKNGIVDTEE